MTLPAILLGVIVSTLLGAAFHLYRGGGIGKLLLYLLLGWIGFWLGQYLGARFNWTLVSVGSLHLAPAIIGGAAFLLVGDWLSLSEPENQLRQKRS